MSPPKSNRPPSSPSFLRLAGHPVRWRLLTELAASDRRVGELSSRLQLRQSLVSYHLGQLRAERIVARRRSASDGRDSYYLLDLQRCGELLAGAGAALHPGLRLTQQQHRRQSATADQPVSVLFSCTGNSARSQMAEALAERLGEGRIEALSAGSHPKPLHPNAVRVMREYGIGLAGRTSKPLSQFSARRFDYVITLCDRVREVCPEFPGQPALMHWSTPDPGREGDTDNETYPAFQRTAAELATRVAFFIDLIDQPAVPRLSRAVSKPQRRRPH